MVIMKTSLFLALVLLSTICCANAQVSYPSCVSNEGCAAPTMCLDGKCRCEHGKKLDTIKRECVDIVGSRCYSNFDCLELESATCNMHSKTCVCNADEGCKNGASSMAVLSTSIMVLFTFGVLRAW